MLKDERKELNQTPSNEQVQANSPEPGSNRQLLSASKSPSRVQPAGVMQLRSVKD